MNVFHKNILCAMVAVSGIMGSGLSWGQGGLTNMPNLVSPYPAPYDNCLSPIFNLSAEQNANLIEIDLSRVNNIFHHYKVRRF